MDSTTMYFNRSNSSYKRGIMKTETFSVLCCFQCFMIFQELAKNFKPENVSVFRISRV